MAPALQPRGLLLCRNDQPRIASGQEFELPSIQRLSDAELSSASHFGIGIFLDEQWNNLKVWSTLIPGPFADKFGFTEPEVDRLLADFHLPELAPAMREWYNGYDFGGKTIYNPWSVINCVDDYPHPPGPQWLNTASNQLVYTELESGEMELKRDLGSCSPVRNYATRSWTILPLRISAATR